MDTLKQKKTPNWAKLGHAKPKSRREFLAAGLIAGAGTYFFPKFSHNLFSANADPVNPCQKSNESPFNGPPVLIFDLAGGASMPGNFLVGGAGGSLDLLESYDTLGWDPRTPDSVDSQFGLPLAKQVSQFRAGLLSTLHPNAAPGLKFGSLCHTSRDDTSANALSIVCIII